MSLNPYETPPDISAEDALRTAESAIDSEDDVVARRITIPAFGLRVTAWMRLSFEGPFFPYACILALEALARRSPWAGVWFLIAAFGAAAIWFDCVILSGADAMLAQRHLSRARLGAALAMVPISPLFLLQLPFGLWSRRVLADREVADRFSS